MCGICGFIDTSGETGEPRKVVGAMCDVIVHRGPDEEGIFVESGTALGMRRLKIIDLATGSQPIFNEDRSVCVVFNGEIYNFSDLKERLIRNGHTFYTNSDTEVLVHLYEDYGENFPDHLNGMFGIALWDKKSRKLLLARDRLGEKPLYYTQTREGLIFGSELKSLCCHPGFHGTLNNEAVYHYFTFNYIPAPLTIYRDVFKLLPGEYLIYEEGRLTVKKYWNPVFRPEQPMDERECEERLYKELCDAVKIRLVSDVPLGAFLSGGIDSSIMVALMSEFSSGPVKTFSIGLENQKASELPFARAVSQKFSTEHFELIAKPDALKLMDRLIWHFDEPFGDSSAIPTFLVSEMTRKEVTVAISGDGGDELFGGYERYQRINDRLAFQKLPQFIRNGISGAGSKLLPFGFTGKAYIEGLKYSDYQMFTAGTSEEYKRFLFTKDFLSSSGSISSHSIGSEYLLHGCELLNQCMFFDMKIYLPDDIMTKVDRMSMANSLECRAPFLDHNLVEFAMRIPVNQKIRNNSKKYILRKLFREKLPEEIFSHKKTGFSIPLSDWFRKELKPLVYDTLSREKIESAGILSFNSVSKIVDQHMRGERNHKRSIWMILMFQLWHDNWISGKGEIVKKALRQEG